MPETVTFLTPTDLHDIVRGMAVVAKLYDAEPDVEFSLDPETKAAVAAWKDVHGNNCHFLFSPEGSVILGFLQASPMNPHAYSTGPDDFNAWQGIYNEMPEALVDRVSANPFGEMFDPEEVTFVLWNTGKTKQWKKGNKIDYPPADTSDVDGQELILERIKGYYNDFCAEFEDNYNWDLDPDAVADMLSGDRVSLSCIRGLKPDSNPAEAREWLPEMGFIIDGSK